MMFKSICCLSVGLYLLSTQCFAMIFSKPVELGNIGGLPNGGFCFEGTYHNEGTSYENGKYDKHWGTKLYEKGVARFGSSEKGLWVYYDCSPSNKREYRELYSPRFGDKTQSVFVSLGAGEGEWVNVNKIQNDGNITMYLLAHYGCVVGLEIYVVMGYDQHGKFVKYIDSREAVKNYLGEENFGMKGIFLKNYYCRGDSIVIEYVDPRKTGDYKSPVGAFRYTWDDKVQWFSVEQVVY